jgi:chromate transporter
MGIGAQSFGGGTATLFLIRRATVERNSWLSEEEFARAWAICQLAPGINLLALTVLIGWRVRGALGIAICLLGLLLPSVSITILLAASYAAIRDVPAVQSALRGVIPATVGFGLALCLNLARPLLVAAHKEGRASLAFAMATLAGSAIWFGLGQPSVLAVLWGAGAAGAAAAWWRVRR